jgi:hypothetical protein
MQLVTNEHSKKKQLACQQTSGAHTLRRAIDLSRTPGSEHEIDHCPMTYVQAKCPSAPLPANRTAKP